MLRLCCRRAMNRSLARSFRRRLGQCQGRQRQPVATICSRGAPHRPKRQFLSQSRVLNLGGIHGNQGIQADEQIGAFQELETAEDAWNAARRRFADIMQGKAANIRQVDIPGRGTWYRVRIGPYDGRQAADVACTDLKERGQDCLVVAP